jgi:hypothetical protein
VPFVTSVPPLSRPASSSPVEAPRAPGAEDGIVNIIDKRVNTRPRLGALARAPGGIRGSRIFRLASIPMVSEPVLSLAGNNANRTVVACPPLRPLDYRDALALLLCGLGLAIAAAGGLGGGDLLVPVYVLVLGLPPKQAIPLSNATVMVRRPRISPHFCRDENFEPTPDHVNKSSVHSLAVS